MAARPLAFPDVHLHGHPCAFAEATRGPNGGLVVTSRRPGAVTCPFCLPYAARRARWTIPVALATLATVAAFVVFLIRC